MRVAIYIFFLFASISFALSQEVVVSEYYNDSNYENEWTELLVTSDNVNLVGYSLRDNSERYNEGGFWQGGVVFANNNLWKNLRRGTIIVINHRGNSAPDSDPSDGYIEIDAENTAFFTKSNWQPIGSLSIAQYGDIVQIRNATGVNVHSLAHVKFSAQGDFYNIAGKKIAYVGDCNIGYSISVGKAIKLEDYNLNTAGQSGYDTGKSLVLMDTIGTKGKPNKNPKGSPINYQFWQKLKQPDFNDARLNAIRKDSTVILTWKNLDIPKNDYGGYIILKTTDIVNNKCKPEDGIKYDVGETICATSEVVAILDGLGNNKFIDKNPFCGTTTRYSIFAFNFNNGNVKNWDYKEGRGIAYSDELTFLNTDTISLDPPPLVEIFSRKGTKFCSMDTTVLYTNLNKIDKSQYSYAWYFKRDLQGSETVLIDFKEPGISDSIKIYKPGYYRLEIKGNDGCVGYSETLNIEIIDQPEAYIANESGFTFSKDTTIYFCGDLNYQLRANLKQIDLKEFITLYKGKIWLNKSGSPFNITAAGTYFFVFKNQNCIDTSAKITFLPKSFEIQASTSELKFYTTPGQQTIQNTLDLTNNDTQDYILEKADVKLLSPFKILNTFPITIPAKASVSLNLEFSPLTFGKYIDTLKINSKCNTSLDIVLLGTASTSNALLTASLDSADFGELIQCTYGSRDTNVTLKNVGSEYIVLQPVIGDANFKVNPIINNDTLFAGESKIINVIISSSLVNVYKDIIKIPWVSENGIMDTTRLLFRAVITVPEYEIIEDTLDFGVISGCESSKIDSLHIINTGTIEITFEDDQFLNGITIVNKPIVIAPGDTAVVYIKFSATSPVKINKRNKFRIIPGCSLIEDFFVKAEKTSGGYDIALPDKIDFGRFYSCNTIDTIIYVDLSVFDKSITGDISLLAIEGDDDFEVLTITNPLTSNSKIPIRFNKNSVGSYNNKISLKFEPCGLTKEINLSANVVDQTVDITQSITFDTYIQGFSANGKLVIRNTNEDNLVISSMQLPSGIKIISSLNFPIILVKDSILTIDIESNVLNVGTYSDSIKCVTNIPCMKDYFITVLGTVLPSDIPPGLFIADFGVDSQIGIPKNEISVQINLDESIYRYNEVNLESISLTLDYPYSALLIKNIESLQSNITVNTNDVNGRLTLDFANVNNEKFKLIDRKLANIKFHVLDITPNEYRLNFVEGTAKSFPIMTIETEDSSFVNVAENCVNTTDYIFTKPVSLNYSIKNNILNLMFIQPTDDIYELRIYDYTGRTEKVLYDGTQGRGEYNSSFDLSNLSSGVYYMVLKYPLEVISKQISIIK